MKKENKSNKTKKKGEIQGGLQSRESEKQKKEPDLKLANSRQVHSVDVEFRATLGDRVQLLSCRRGSR